MGYALPTHTSFVSSSWQDHKNRNPPSGEPGTDYGAGYNSVVYAPEAGTIIDLKTSNSGGTGRYVAIAMVDGRTTRTLHMARVEVSVGMRVSRGQRLGLSGASGFGDDWYYGPHVHQTLWPGAYWAAPTIDFALYVGGASPTPPQPQPPEDEEEEMTVNSGFWYPVPSSGPNSFVYLICNAGSGWYHEYGNGAGNGHMPGGYNNGVAGAFQTGPFAQITEGHARTIKATLDAVKPPTKMQVEASVEIDPADAVRAAEAGQYDG